MSSLASLPSELLTRIHQYYQRRKLIEPTSKDALLWAQSELGEAVEELMRGEVWVRNNPKPPFNRQEFAEELGDTLMMVLKAGYAAGVDPLAALLLKMERKEAEHANSSDRPT